MSLSTFVATRTGGVPQALEALLGVAPLRWEDRAEHRDDDPLAVLVAVPLAGAERGLELEFSTPSGAGRAFFTGQQVAFSYRTPDGAGRAEIAAELERVRRRVAASDAAAAGGALGELRQSLANLRSYGPVRDWMYRQANPREVLIRLGFRCNQDCWFCWQGRDWPEAPDGLYARWLEEFAAQGHQVVAFSGGEPTLHRQLPELVARAVALGMTPWVQTNAIQLAKPKVLRRLVDAGLHGAFVSYHSADPAVSDAMTRAPGTHSRTQAGIAAALAAGLTVRLNCVVEAANVAGLAAHAADIVARFVRPFPDNPVQYVIYSHPCEYYDEAQWQQSVVPLPAVAGPLLGALDVLADAGVPVEGVGSCGFPACLFKDAPQVLRWLRPEAEDDQDLVGRTYAPACDDCAVKSRCLGLRKEVIDATGAVGIAPFAEVPEGWAD